MLILDTDHMSEIGRGSGSGNSLRSRLAGSVLPKATTIVTVEELFRGRLAQTAKARSGAALAAAYERLHATFDDLANWTILPFHTAAVAAFDQLRVKRLNIGTMDLRIASIALSGGHTLHSRNLRDFERTPDLKVEDWLP